MNQTKLVYVDSEEFLMLLNRALNTWEPQDAPDWAFPVADALEAGNDVMVMIEHG